MAAVAIKSSISASEFLPDMACGFSSGSGEKRSSVDGLIFDRLAWPMVQPA